MKHENRLEVVDFVKGLAITAIMFFHCYEAIYGWPGHDLFSFLSGGLLSSYLFRLDSLDSIVKGLLKLTGLGYQGVSVFVVMSGFLQMWSSRGEKLELNKYYLKRFSRLYPLYWLAIFGVLGLNLFLKRNTGVSGQQLYGAFLGWAPLLTFNPSFWFITLIVQFYLIFPFLRDFLVRIGERKFLFVALLVTIYSLFIRSFLGAFGRFFVGSWLVEFGVGMVLTNHFSEVDSKLRGFKAVALMLIAYVLGISFTNSPITLLVSRPVYGIALTLLLWSIYNTIREVDALQVLKRLFVFIGLNSFAMFLINQPFIQEYYVFMMLLFNPYRSLRFQSEVAGDAYNLIVLPIGTYLVMMLVYVVVIVFLSYILTGVEERIHRRLTALLTSLPQV